MLPFSHAQELIAVNEAALVEGAGADQRTCLVEARPAVVWDAPDTIPDLHAALPLGTCARHDAGGVKTRASIRGDARRGRQATSAYAALLVGAEVVSAREGFCRDATKGFVATFIWPAKQKIPRRCRTDKELRWHARPAVHQLCAA